MAQYHKTKPDLYEGNLSDEASQQRATVERQLEKLYQDAQNEENFVKKQKILRRAETLETQLELQGANPKKVDFDTLVGHVRGPHGLGPMENQARARIKNRATGIRAYCMECMCGDSALVRECVSVCCPLHPFRMGKDPFRGWDIPKAEEIEIELEEGEDEDQFVDEDD